MRVLLVTHYYAPEVGAPQSRLGELASHWASMGIETTVLTGMPNHPTGVVHDGYKRAIRRIERRRGVQIVRTWLYATPNEGFLKKTLGHLSFMVTSVLLGVRPTGRADVVLVSSPTFFSIFSAWFLARVKKAAFVVEVRDLWPGIFVELGVLTNPLLIAGLERLELAAYRAADHVVVVTEGFRDNLMKRGVPAHKVSVIRNGVDVGRFDPGAPPSAEARGWLGATASDTLVLYIGAHGVSQRLDSVVETAKLLEESGIHFALVGEGADKSRVARHLQELNISNLTMRDAVPRDRVPALIAAADICLVPLRDVPLFDSFIPSKMFEFLAAGRAVVASVRGESAAILQEAGARVVPPEDPSSLADALRELAGDTAATQEMAESGRAFVVQHFRREDLAARYAGILQRVARKGRGS